MMLSKVFLRATQKNLMMASPYTQAALAMPRGATSSTLSNFNLRSFATTDADESSHSDFQPQSKTKAGDSTEVSEHISKWIEENDICVFMKGTRKMPQCGFSKYVMVLFNAYGVKNLKDVNVLADDTLRSTIKEYSNWPTIPQVYIKGEFIGGCDIMKEMHEDGSLRELLIREKVIEE